MRIGDIVYVALDENGDIFPLGDETFCNSASQLSSALTGNGLSPAFYTFARIKLESTIAMETISETKGAPDADAAAIPSTKYCIRPYNEN